MMMESTDIKVKLNSVEQVRQFVETIRKYDGDVDVYSTMASQFLVCSV